MNTEIKAVLFDLDGTLVDTAPDLVATLNHQLVLHKLPEVSFDDARLLVSQGTIPLIEFGFAEHYKIENLDTLRNEFLKIYAEVSSQHSELFKGMQEVIDYIESKQLPWGIVTNKPQDLAIDLLEKMNLHKRLSAFYGGDTLAKRKPDPDQLLAASKDIKIETQNILYLGDDERDIIAAKSAGMPNAVMNYGYINTSIPPLDWNADYYFDTALEIIDLLKSRSSK